MTGDLENLEPNEDGGAAVDLISETEEGRIEVNGTVGEGDDRFAFSGEFIEVDIPEGVQVDISER